MMQSFETTKEATNRTKASREKISTGITKPKNHIGSHSSYVWNKVALEEEVTSATILT